ncbi:MAG: hypothetical protein ACRCYJ_00395, partial [Plesiomonas shigelloides]
FKDADVGKNGLPTAEVIAEGPNVGTYTITTKGDDTKIAFTVPGKASTPLEGHAFVMKAIRGSNGSIAWYKSCTYTGKDTKKSPLCVADKEPDPS